LPIVVVFDPEKVADRATFEQPHQYAVGMTHVFVNGRQVIRDGVHTGEKPGRALWGPGKVAEHHGETLVMQIARIVQSNFASRLCRTGSRLAGDGRTRQSAS
jgi:hypothetical protein